MAQPLTSGAGSAAPWAWHGEGVTVGEVLEALARLRNRELATATRTSVVNLVMVADGEHDAERACEAMHRLDTRHPGRTVVLVRQRGRRRIPGLDADVRLYGAEARGHSVWSEEVRLWVRGPLVDHLDSLIEPLTLPDLPVAVWFVRGPPHPEDPLLPVADVVVIDARNLPFDARLSDLASRHTVCDLSWLRLQPWREALANLFELPAFRPFLAGIRGAAVTGKPGPRHLVGGWLGSRLGLEPSQVELVDGRHLAARVMASRDGHDAVFSAVRASGRRLVIARAEVDGRFAHEDRLALAEDSLPWSLGKALTRLEWDPSYGRALHVAVGFAS